MPQFLLPNYSLGMSLIIRDSIRFHHFNEAVPIAGSFRATYIGTTPVPIIEMPPFGYHRSGDMSECLNSAR
jgi:hypothetical protein